MNKPKNKMLAMRHDRVKQFYEYHEYCKLPEQLKKLLKENPEMTFTISKRGRGMSEIPEEFYEIKI